MTSLMFPVLIASSLVVLVAFSSAYVLYISDEALRRWMPRLIAIAVGVLLGDAFLHLLPDALALAEDTGDVFLWTLAGILGFYGIEQGMQWRHEHTLPGITDTGSGLRPLAAMNLLGDGIHNFTDGVLIAASFMADPLLGMATTAAIVIHEVPQEISDIAVLIKGGLKKRRAVFLNVLCALSCPLGAMLTLALAHYVTLSLSALLSITAGGFIYIATTDLMPVLREKDMRLSLPVQASATATGLITMAAILWLEMWV